MKKILVYLVVIMPFLMSCGSDNDTLISLNKSDVQLLHGETFQLKVTGSNDKPTYIVENSFIASVDEDGLVTGKVRGETDILVKAGEGTVKCHVKVNTKINFIPEPYLNFGQSFSSVKDIVTKDNDIMPNGIKITDGASIALLRKIDDVQYIYGYTFKNNVLESVMILYNAKAYESKLSSFLSFILERYCPVTQTGTYQGIMITTDKKVMIVTDLSSDGLFSVYYTLKK